MENQEYNNDDRIVTWYSGRWRDEPSRHLNFKWRCPCCGFDENELNTDNPDGYAEVKCDGCDSLFHFKK